MKNKKKITGKSLDGSFISLVVGIFLGVCSSFLGIGGGPINVALIIYLFSVSTKTATVCSLVTILFAQISKLTTVALTTGFSNFDLSIAPLMIIGAIFGGFIGAGLNKKCSEKTVEKAFNCVQLLVLGITIFNIIRTYIRWALAERSVGYFCRYLFNKYSDYVLINILNIMEEELPKLAFNETLEL